MKSTKRFFVGLATLSFLLSSLYAQTGSTLDVTKQFYKAYTANSNPAWKIILNQLEQQTDKSENLELLLAKGYYAAAGIAMGNQDKDLAGAMLDKAATSAEYLLKRDKEDAEANALLSAVYGMKIGLSPMKGMLLGSKSASAASKGVDLAPDNAFTNYVMGSYLFYTPSMFGGDASKSITFLEKSKTIYEQENQMETWEYMNMMTLLGQVYYGQKQYAEAKETYETALKIAPDFGYIKMYLLPQVEKMLKK